MDLKKEKYELLLLERKQHFNNNLQATRLKCRVRTLSNVEFLMSAKHLF